MTTEDRLNRLIELYKEIAEINMQTVRRQQEDYNRQITQLNGTIARATRWLEENRVAKALAVLKGGED